MSGTQRFVEIADIMTSAVHTIAPDDPIERACELLTDGRCHHLPVVDDGRPVGMLSTRDLVRFAQDNGAETFSAQLLAGATVSALMTKGLEVVHADDPVETAVDRIGRGDIHSLVVLDKQDQLAGIVTHRDLLHYLMN